jgi:hypothetical protein
VLPELRWTRLRAGSICGSGLGRNPSASVDLGNKRFRKEIDALVLSAMLAHLDRLNSIATNEIDRHRQRAQHREGLAVVRHEPGGWYLAPEGAQRPRSQDLPLADLLLSWPNAIEAAVCDILASGH